MYKKVDKDVKDIIDKYQYDQSIRKHANKYYFHDNSIFRKITSKDDVSRYEQCVRGTINQYKDIYPLVTDDIIELEKALGKYEDAVKKVLQCYSDDDFGFDYTAGELQALINQIFEFEKDISEIHLRKACQD
ncbi:MAG TPA: hypothetical protein PK566_15545 [Pseudobacteroides sp.]|nr:hypothetical protein [Pseudobacteroides sp.]